MKFVSATEADKAYFGDLFRTVYSQKIEEQFGGRTIKQFEHTFAGIRSKQSFRKIYLEDQLVGAIWVEQHDDFWQLREIQIEPDFQGKGIGTEVILGEMEIAKSAGVELRLRVLLQNRAINLYEELGFTKTREDQTHAYMSYCS